MICAPGIGHMNLAGAMGSATTPLDRFGPSAGSTGTTSIEPGVTWPRMRLKSAITIGSTPWALARLASARHQMNGEGVARDQGGHQQQNAMGHIAIETQRLPPGFRFAPQTRGPNLAERKAKGQTYW